jgi:hypothetical protein
MKKAFDKYIKFIFVVIAGTITIMLTANMIYATKTEVNSLVKSIDVIYLQIIEIRKEVSCIKNMLIEKNFSE